MMIQRYFIIFLCCVSWRLFSQETQVSIANVPAGKLGEFLISFRHRSRLSSGEEMKKRYGWTLSKEQASGLKYVLPEESFWVYVPEKYSSENPYGLMVWVNAGDDGNAPAEWKSFLDQYRLIWIGALNSGNERPSLTRYGLAIDAVENMKKLYTLDLRRIYISGMSGGGRVASRLALSYPDVFSGGGFYLIGCNYYRTLPTSDNKVFPGFWPKPKKDLLALAKKNRYVFLTGSKDFNQPQTKLVYEAYLKDKFESVLYLEVPEMEHTLPSADWYEKGLIFLEPGDTKELPKKK